jgi:5'-3' exonuclease
MKKIILVDFSQLFYINLYRYIAQENITNLGDDDLETLIRMLIFDGINYYVRRFRIMEEKDNKMVLCIDDGSSYWRRSIFPGYKRNRKRESKFFNYAKVMNVFSSIIKEYKDLSFVYMFIDEMEADDIIAVICDYHKEDDSVIIILSNDKDFKQLLSNKVSLYSIRGGTKRINDEEYDLFEHIIKGDYGDGIPNILTNIDKTFLEKNKRITKKMISNWSNEKTLLENSDNSIKSRYLLNKQLIDLSSIPTELKGRIIEGYKNVKDTIFDSDIYFEYIKRFELERFI